MPFFFHPENRKSLLFQVRKTCLEVSAQGQENYWLIYNGTISIFTLSSPLIAFGYAQLAVEYLPTSCLQDFHLTAKALAQTCDAFT